jgi:hypothetical protein
MVSDPRTRHHVDRRTKEGLSKKEIIRCLKLRRQRALSLSRQPRNNP